MCINNRCLFCVFIVVVPQVCRLYKFNYLFCLLNYVEGFELVVWFVTKFLCVLRVQFFLD